MNFDRPFGDAKWSDSLDNCISLFKNIYEKLVNEETENYPYHYDILEKKNELYMKYYEKREKYESNIKISKNSKDPQSDIMNKMENFDKSEKDYFIKNINNFYESLLNTIKDNKLQYDNLKKEYQNFIMNNFSYQMNPDQMH